MNFLRQLASRTIPRPSCILKVPPCSQHTRFYGGKGFLTEEQPPLDQEHTKRRFAGKAAIVTGGASGIGRATVERFLNDGARVAVFDLNADLGEDLERELSSKGKNVKFYRVDVSDKEQCEKAAADFARLSTEERLHYLVNCAVYFGSEGLTATKSDWDRSLNVNVQGYANMVQVCHPFMIRATGEGDDCAVVNLASVSAHIAQPIRWTYSATKGAAVIMTKCMALDLSADGIRVNSVSPPWVWTPEVAKAAENNREKYEKIWGPFHMKRKMAETSEIAAAICFLCSKDASYITGTDLKVDGGYLSLGPEGLGEKSAFAATKKQ
eukprot:m.311489 g.311489  ORF g.311489 m.311489 type:complete len:324 (+) comp73124_c0_seq1:24-995(+)